VPFAIGWYGEIGGEALSFIRRIVGHYVRDERTAAWRVRKILAAIQTRHLNILGVYLQNCRFDMESRGPIFFHRGQTTTGRLSPNTNTEEGTLTQESGDVRRVEGEVCGAVLVDE
jgi:hypothetical protein